MTKHYVFDAGHGGKDPGAVGNGLHESDINLYMSMKTEEYLINGWEGIKVTQTRTSDRYLSLKERTDLANTLCVDGFVSYHVNAGGGTGFETHIFKSQDEKSQAYKLSKSIYDEVMKVYDGKGRGIKRTDLHVTRETNMKATLMENLFIDSKADAELLKSKDFKNKIAKAVATGIAKHEGLKAKKSTSNPSKKPSETTSKKTHTVVKGDTLWGISQKYNVSISQLKSWNKLKSNIIIPKQKLRIK